eukprot:scaffold76373_cov65-Cyclotella_meneghiniana.AAC.4
MEWTTGGDERPHHLSADAENIINTRSALDDSKPNKSQVDGRKPKGRKQQPTLNVDQKERPRGG